MKVSAASRRPVQAAARSMSRKGSQVDVSRRERPTEAAQLRRLRTAGMTLTAFMCLFLLLGLSGNLGWKEAADSAGANGTSGYLYAGAPMDQKDPLCLVGRIPYLELTGVSADGSVIGYASIYPAQSCAIQLIAVLEADGWMLYDNNGAGFLSFYQREAKGADSSTLFVQLIAVGRESAIVINRF